MTTRLLPLFLALLAAASVQAAPQPAAGDDAARLRPVTVAFAFGRGLVAPAARETPLPDPAPPAPVEPSADATRKVHPYRAACNYTTGCH